MDPDTQLAWEKRHRPRAGIAALAGAAGLMVLYVVSQIVQRDAPTTSFLASLSRAGAPGDVGQQPSLQIPFFEYLDSKLVLVIAIGVGGFIGFVGVAWAVGFLAVATRARDPALKRFMVYVPIVGGVAVGLGVLMGQIATVLLIDRVLSGPRTVAAAISADNDLGLWANALLEFGSLVLAVGLILVSLNAMRAGLLTRLFGYIGIVAGAMLILYPLPVVQIFWMGGLGVLFLGRWPGGDLPAWSTGRAVPWPVRAAPARQPAPASGPAAGAPRRKRKKRH